MPRNRVGFSRFPVSIEFCNECWVNGWRVRCRECYRASMILSVVRANLCSYLLVLLDEGRVCDRVNCRNHLFYGFSAGFDGRWNRFWNCVMMVDGEVTLEEIGDIYGISRERVRQIEERAIRFLRIIFDEEEVRSILRAMDFLRDLRTFDGRALPARYESVEEAVLETWV